MQIATNADFTNPQLDVPYNATAYYVWSNAAANTTYHYRVKTWNDGGESGWSTGSFQTVAPRVQVTVPNGGEVWQRGLKYFIQWQDNLAEPVVIDLYKGGVFLQLPEHEFQCGSVPMGGLLSTSFPATITRSG